MKRLFLFFTVFFLFFTELSFSEVFQNFLYGDSPEQVSEKIADQCKVSPVLRDTRWKWRSRIKCRNFLYKGVETTIHFHFSNDELSRISIFSIDMPNLFLYRKGKSRYLLPRQTKPLRKGESANLIDKLIFQDKVHYQKNGQKLTYFFYKGQWEWELLFESSGYRKEDLKLMKAQLKSEEKKGLSGWKTFHYGQTSREIRTKLEGLCRRIDLDESAVFQGVKSLICKEFSFLDQKISARFKLYDEKLVTVQLILPVSLYPTLLPLLKRKYGEPYIEYKNDLDYYPYIIFPATSLELTHILLSGSQQVALSLKYIKKGYIDPIELKKFKKKVNKKSLKKIKTKSEVIMDNI